MADLEESMREEIRAAVEELEAVRQRLTSAYTHLPTSPRQDVMFLGEEEWDFATEARTLIECVLRDELATAIEELEKLKK
ncbi:MAG TPA: hypothetical protein VGK45_18810 [Thermoanaerobaculia bacterium]|jgi:hypothetical protein